MMNLFSKKKYDKRTNEKYCFIGFESAPIGAFFITEMKKIRGFQKMHTT